jgi:hypothetical protein
MMAPNGDRATPTAICPCPDCAYDPFSDELRLYFSGYRAFLQFVNTASHALDLSGATDEKQSCGKLFFRLKHGPNTEYTVLKIQLTRVTSIYRLVCGNFRPNFFKVDFPNCEYGFFLQVKIS